MKGLFENSLQLTRFMLRRERITSAVWIVLLLIIVAGLVPGMYTALDYYARLELISVFENPAMVAMAGPVFAAENPTFGAVYANLMFVFVALTVGIMNIFLIVRHTRADEEKGRYEVVRSLPLGRLANINAAMITALIINGILAITMGLAMYLGGMVGDTYMCLAGSMLWGVGLGVTGLVFAALTALLCQLSAITRSVMAYSFVTLIVLYLVRAIGDMNTDLEWVALISPLGLILRTQVYIQNNWWPIWIMLGTTAVVAAAAFYLTSIRDIDQGMIPAKPGKADGGFLLKSAPGLTFRLQRFTIIMIVVGMFILGGTYGAVLADIESFVASNEMYQTLILGPFMDISVLEGLPVDEAIAIMNQALSAAGVTVAEMFSGFINGMMAVMGLAALIVFTTKAKSEEKDIRTELVLAASVSRTKYLAGFVAIAMISAILLQAAVALGMYAVATTTLVNPGDLSISFVLRSALVFVPALWIMVGITVLLVGLLPKATGFIWGYLGYSFFMDMFGRIDIFPSWVARTTPFGWVPLLPLEEINWITMAVKVMIAIALTAAGFYFYNKRDINAVNH
ncbi:MAG: hypothetical protein FWE11_07235 [Defluviitaleaceae bacterium]|nr:hypothetical protein [Defluviitaleaceae bacterium]